MNEAVYYDVTGEQVQNWHYHHSLSDDHAHQVVIIDTVVRDLDLVSMEKAIELMIRRHESLRSYFRVVEGEIKQCVIPYDAELFTTSYYDMSAFGDEERMIREIRHIIEGDKRSLRKLTDPPLLRSCIFKIPDNSYYLFIALHHIISDEWSTSIVYKEVSMYYERLMGGKPVNIIPLAVQIRDYALWQKKWLEENWEQVHGYWMKKIGVLMKECHPREIYKRYRDLSEFPVEDNGAAAIMSGDKLHSILNNSKAASYACHADLSKYDRLLRFSFQSRVGICTLLASGLQLLFYALGKEKMLISTPVSSRSLPGTESLIGCLGGGVYLSRTVRPEMIVKDFINEGYLEFLESAMHLIYDHGLMQLDGNALRLHCDVFLNFIGKEITGNKKTHFDYNYEHRPLENPEYYALAFIVTEHQGGLSVFWKYNLTLYSPERIAFMARKHDLVLQAMCQNPGITVKQLVNYILKKQ